MKRTYKYFSIKPTYQMNEQIIFPDLLLLRNGCAIEFHIYRKPTIIDTNDIFFLLPIHK